MFELLIFFCCSRVQEKNFEFQNVKIEGSSKKPKRNFKIQQKKTLKNFDSKLLTISKYF